MFSGTTTSTDPTSTTTWKATATVVQWRQLASAYASLRLSAVSPSAQTSANETSYSTDPSVVLTASAWLSPSPGGIGRSNGKTQVGAASPDAAASVEAPPSEAGTSTSASAGWSAVGTGPASAGQRVVAVPSDPSPSARLLAAGTASSTVPPSQARTGRYRSPVGHHAQTSPATSAAATSTASPRRPDRPSVRRHTAIPARRTVRSTTYPMPSIGTTTATTASTRARTPSTSPSPKAAASSALCWRSDAHAVASNRGRASTIRSREAAISGTTTSTQAITTTRAQVFSAVASGCRQRPGSRPLITGPMRW